MEAKQPAHAVIRAASGLTPGRALDLACGAGRHAIWLHQHGWQVTAVDRDTAAIGALRMEYPDMDLRVVDLEQQPMPAEGDCWDLVVCWLYYQADLYPRIREAVRPGGVAASCALLTGRFAAKSGELLSYFPDWNILHHAEGDHGQGKRSLELVVRKSQIETRSRSSAG